MRMEAEMDAAEADELAALELRLEAEEARRFLNPQADQDGISSIIDERWTTACLNVHMMEMRDLKAVRKALRPKKRKKKKKKGGRRGRKGGGPGPRGPSGHESARAIYAMPCWDTTKLH